MALCSLRLNALLSGEISHQIEKKMAKSVAYSKPATGIK